MDVGFDKADDMVTDAAIDYLLKNDIDFTFLYLGYPDGAGHMHGWMGKEYMDAIENSWKNIERIVNVLPDDYTVFITADHGGHERCHGDDIKEDMLIPLIIIGDDFKENTVIENANIKDIAPTVTKVLGVEADKEWEGKSII